MGCNDFRGLEIDVVEGLPYGLPFQISERRRRIYEGFIQECGCLPQDDDGAYLGGIIDDDPAATEAAPPQLSLRSITFNTATGASGLIRSASP